MVVVHALHHPDAQVCAVLEVAGVREALGAVQIRAPLDVGEELLRPGQVQAALGQETEVSHPPPPPAAALAS